MALAQLPLATFVQVEHVRVLLFELRRREWRYAHRVGRVSYACRHKVLDRDDGGVVSATGSAADAQRCARLTRSVRDRRGGTALAVEHR
eukprot:5279533-Pleurochrysis_carterae.AAC.3